MRAFAAGIGIVLVFAASTAWTATSSVSPSGAGQDGSPIGPNEVKPSECSSVTLTNIAAGTGTVAGGAGADLVVAGAGSDALEGRDGDDCLVSGGGDDTLDGGPGTDICLGGPGTDEFIGCEAQSQ